MTRSPWQRALGSRAASLSPGLRNYFGAIPVGGVGVGRGAFRVVGTPRKWIWPFFAIAAREGIAFPAWAAQVPFTVHNRAGAHGTVTSERTFHFAHGDWVMTDRIGIAGAGLVDRLGRHGLLEVALAATVVEGSLQLRSRAATLRVLGLRIPLGALAPVVSLTERSAGSSQAITLTVDLPLVGRLYEYDGEFHYEVVRDA